MTTEELDVIGATLFAVLDNPLELGERAPDEVWRSEIDIRRKYRDLASRLRVDLEAAGVDLKSRPKPLAQRHLDLVTIPARTAYNATEEIDAQVLPEV